jgi:ABC-2 type transport system permease protein
MKFRALRAQVAAETRMTLQRGETLLVTLGIPVVLLVFFTLVPVLATGTRHRVDFLAPGVLALAVMSTAMVSLGIATAFERSYGVLKRLGATPLGRPVLLTAKIASVIVVEIIQVVLLVGVALALGWRPHPSAGLAVIAVLLATIAFAGIGLAMAGALRAEVTLAVANGVYVILLLIGGVIFPLHELGSLASFARLLPTAALSDALHGTLGSGASATEAWVVLALWAVAAPVVAAVTFKWE